MARRTKLEAQATRELLLDAAERLFMAQGLGRTTLGEIAQAADLSRGAVYWHFTDKAALVHALVDRVDLPLEQALLQAERDTAADPVARLHDLALEPFRLMQQDPRAMRVFMILLHRADFYGDLADLADRHDDALCDCTLRMQRLFEQAQAGGRLADGCTPALAAHALLALNEGLMRRATDPMTHAEAPRVDDAVVQAAGCAVKALLAGLTRPAPAPAPAPAAETAPAPARPPTAKRPRRQA